MPVTIATIDALAGGNRVICGIGVSGPQIVEDGTGNLGVGPIIG